MFQSTKRPPQPRKSCLNYGESLTGLIEHSLPSCVVCYQSHHSVPCPCSHLRLTRLHIINSTLSTMLSRKSSLARSSSQKGHSILRRNTVSVSSTAPTKSEMLDPNEKKQQAVAAAQRAFVDHAVRRTHGSQSSSDMRPRLSERNLNQLPSSRPPITRGPSTTGRPTTAPPASTVASSDYGYSQAPSSITNGSSRRHRFDEEESIDGGDYESTVVRRRESMRWHRENLTPARNNRQEASSRKAEVDSYVVPDYSPPRLDSSTPSSFRRIRKTRSAFAVSQIFSPSDQDVSSVFYGAGSPRKMTDNRDNSRKSMSFLRGGTEFMGEGKTRERRSYYMESAQRKNYPPIVPPEVANYKGKNEKGEWGAMRLKKKARKVFGSMRRALGMGCSNDPDLMGSIPEQHVPSSRLHFRDYITPEEANAETYAAPGKFGVKEKPKIRSNYVISKAPTLHLVPSQEMIRSDVGSVREVSPPLNTGPNRKVSPASVATVSTGTWNSTIASRMSARTLRGNTLDGTLQSGRTSPVLEGDDALYFKPPPRRERLNVDARRVYSALVKRFNADEQSKPVESSQDTGYYMTPGIGLLPEEEGIFERHIAPSSLGRRTSIGSTSSRATVKQTPAPETAVREPMEVEYEYEPESPPPPVPKIPKIFLEPGAADGSGPRRNQSEGLDRNRYDSSSVRSNRRTPRGSTAAAPPPTVLETRDVPRKGPFSGKLEGLPTSRPMGGVEANASVDTFSTSTDAALSACHLQMIRNRRSVPGKFASNENLRKSPVVPKRPVPPEAGEDIRRSRSVLEYREAKAQALPERTRTPMGYDRPLSQNLLFRAGLRNLDSNVQAPIAGSHEPPLVITKRASRTSLSGRVSRMSMRECDVGLAVARQFGPVAGQRLDAAGDYGYRMRDDGYDRDGPAFL
jgi:hypothetical protein